MTTLDQQPPATPRKRLSTWTMTSEALTRGFDAGTGFLGRARGDDFAEFRCGGRRFVSIAHPDYIEHVLLTARTSYVKSVEYEPFRALAGVNLLTDEGDSWAAHRGALNQIFARRHLNSVLDLMIEPIADVTAALATGDHTQFDMHQMMVETSLRVLANALFGQDFGPLIDSMNDLTTPALRRLEKLQRLALWGLMPRPVYDALAWCTYSGLPLPPPLRGLQKTTLALDRAVNSLIDERLGNPTTTGDLLNVLLNAEGGSWPRKRIRDEALIFMLAGHEATSNTLSWFWYLMALHPSARDRMLAEIDLVLGGRRPTAEDIGKLPWTTACIQEAQRYFPSVWVIARETVEDDVIGGHPIRKGTTIIIPAYHVHHDPRWWSDPAKFDPERFVSQAEDRPRWAYLPFGGGRRVCIGQSFAMMEMLLITVMMSQRFTFNLLPGRPVEPETTLVLRPKHGVHVVAHSRI